MGTGRAWGGRDRKAEGTQEGLEKGMGLRRSRGRRAQASRVQGEGCGEGGGVWPVRGTFHAPGAP